MEWITEENSSLVSFFLSGKKKIFFLCVFKDVKVWYEKKYLVRNVKKNNLIFYMMKKNSILKIFCFFSWKKKKKYAQTQNFTRKLAFVLNFFLLLAYWDSNKKDFYKENSYCSFIFASDPYFSFTLFLHQGNPIFFRIKFNTVIMAQESYLTDFFLQEL